MAGQSSLCIGVKACLNSARKASRAAGLPTPLCNPAVASKWMPRRLRAALALSIVGVSPFGVFADEFDVGVAGFATLARRCSKGRSVQTVQSMMESGKGGFVADVLRIEQGSACVTEAAIAVDAMPCANWRRLRLFMLPSGAKASLNFWLSSAQLKSCPGANASSLPFDFAGAAKGLPVFFGLVGIEGAEFGQGFGEGLAVSEITGDDQRIAGAGMSAREQLAANFAESHQPVPARSVRSMEPLWSLS